MLGALWDVGWEGVGHLGVWEDPEQPSPLPPGDPALGPHPHSCTGRGCSQGQREAWACGGCG